METTGKKHTKSLDTLVPDINKLLVNLTYKKKVNVSEEQISKFLNNIKEVIMDFTNPMKADKKVLRMSILGRPARQLWYDRHRPFKKTTQDPALQLKFLTGHFMEHLILFLEYLNPTSATCSLNYTLIF